MYTLFHLAYDAVWVGGHEIRHVATACSIQIECESAQVLLADGHRDVESGQHLCVAMVHNRYRKT